MVALIHGGIAVNLALLFYPELTRPLSISQGRIVMRIIGFRVAAVAVMIVGLLASEHAPAQQGSEASIIPLFPLKEAELKGMRGFPPGMTPYSFWAARGTAKFTPRGENGVEIVFDFEGLIPYGVYTLWNVLETEPFEDEPLGPYGAGKHSVVADGNGKARKVVVLDKWPGKEFLLDYHADGKLSQQTGVYPGALWGRFPEKPLR